MLPTACDVEFLFKKPSSSTVCLTLQVNCPFRMHRMRYCSLVIILKYVFAIHRLHVVHTSSRSAGDFMADLLVEIKGVEFSAGP